MGKVMLVRAPKLMKGCTVDFFGFRTLQDAHVLPHSAGFRVKDLGFRV